MFDFFCTSIRRELATWQVSMTVTLNGGPVACPAHDTLLIAATISASDMKMCGATGKWTYFNAISLLNDANLYATYTGNTAGTNVNIAQVPFLDGRSGFESGTNMVNARSVMLLSGDAASSAVLLTSGTITGQVDFKVKSLAHGTAMVWSSTATPILARTWQIARCCTLRIRTGMSGTGQGTLPDGSSWLEL